MVSVTLIISTCNQPDYLGRILRAVSAQSAAPDQVLLADDGSGDETRALWAEWAGKQTFRTAHVWQPHEGFRKARVLNEAIAQALANYIVFLDGDTLPHPEFLADHREHAQAGAFVQGHRALIQQQAARWFGWRELRADRRRALWQGQLRGIKHAFRWPMPWLRQRTDLHGIRGCNLAIWRNDLLLVNGFNEAFMGWGREDSELAARLLNSERARWDVRGRALCYHLWHPPASRAGLAANDELLAQTLAKKLMRCEVGLDRHFAQERFPGGTSQTGTTHA